jgi:hypothetical protein
MCNFNTGEEKSTLVGKNQFTGRNLIHSFYTFDCLCPLELVYAIRNIRRSTDAMILGKMNKNSVKIGSFV